MKIRNDKNERRKVITCVHCIKERGGNNICDEKKNGGFQCHAIPNRSK